MPEEPRGWIPRFISVSPAHTGERIVSLGEQWAGILVMNGDISLQRLPRAMVGVDEV